MKKFVSFLALGDNLISLSLLEKTNQPNKIGIIGTELTQKVASIMNREDVFDIEVLFSDVPAFYDIKKQGIFAAVKDICKFRNYIKSNKVKEVVFEKKDWRIFLLTVGLGLKVFSSNTYKNIYDNRRCLINEAYGHSIKNSMYDIFDKIRINKVAINPASRVAKKSIKADDLITIISFLSSYHFQVTLVDYEKRYISLRNNVDLYITNTTLEDMKDIIAMNDLYLGPDSFLIHLAYYLQKPFFVIFYDLQESFLPPVLQPSSNSILVSAKSSLESDLRTKFQILGLV